jgi:integrase
VLQEAQILPQGNNLVFPSSTGKASSDATYSKLIRELGFSAHIHGFRTSFRTWGQEKTDYPWEVQEAALNHVVGSAVEVPYARSDVFEKRRQMMEDWVEYLASK